MGSAVLLQAETDFAVVKKREVIQVGEEIRMYSIAYPKNLEPNKPCPLIVAFRGYRGEAKAWFYEYSAFEPMMARQPFIILYPEGPIAWGPSLSGSDLHFSM